MRNTLPPQPPRPDTWTISQRHGWAVLGRAVLMGSISQQGGTEGCLSPAAHIPSAHFQAIPSLTPYLPHGLEGFSEVFSLLPPTSAGPHTKSSCQAPLHSSSSQAGAVKEQEPQQPQERGFAPHTHRDPQNITGLWSGLMGPSFARLSSSGMGGPRCHFEQQEHSSSRKMPSARSFPTGGSNAENKEGISLAAALRLSSSRSSKGMALLKQFCQFSLLHCFACSRALHYLLCCSVRDNASEESAHPAKTWLFPLGYFCRKAVGTL